MSNYNCLVQSGPKTHSFPLPSRDKPMHTVPHSHWPMSLQNFSSVQFSLLIPCRS